MPLRSLGLFAGAGISTTSGSYGESRYVIEQRWQQSATTVTADDVNAGAAAFRGLEALIVPDGSNPTGGLTAQGQQNLRDWVAAGGVLVGLRRAHNLARSAGLTSTTVKDRAGGLPRARLALPGRRRPRQPGGARAGRARTSSSTTRTRCSTPRPRA